MSRQALFFDEVRHRAEQVLDEVELLADMPRVYLVRSLFGRLGVAVSASARTTCGEPCRQVLDCLASALRDRLGAYARADDGAVLWVDDGLLDGAREAAREIRPGFFWVDRLLVGGNWWTVGEEGQDGPIRYTLHSVKGGMGRSTTAAVLAWRLACQGHDVLVVDLDIESPGLASAVFGRKEQPQFGVVDWFVEELVGQGDRVIDDMYSIPAWAHDLQGNVWVAPAHGRDAGEYLAKLGRVYVDTAEDPWICRLRRLVDALESTLKPGVVLLESRSGLHDIAAATVTDLGARVMLFAVDSPSTWTAYRILFDHWRAQGIASRIRERLSIVSALTPPLAPGSRREYLERFREKSWGLFRDHLYDSLEPSLEPADDSPNAVSWDLEDEDAPHSPFVVDWNLGLAGGSLRDLEGSTVEQAYSSFLHRFDQLHRPAADAFRHMPETLRIAISELPEGTSHGRPPSPAHVYLPPSHRKALHPNVMLVTGVRGSGKTLWWSALQDPTIRALLDRVAPGSTLTAGAEVRAGFGVIDAPGDYPGPDELSRMLKSGIDPRIIWRTIHARHVAGREHTLADLDSWRARADYVGAKPGAVSRLFRDRDEQLQQREVYSLVVFDGLDRSADEWPKVLELIRGLLRHALDMRSYKRLRAKVFLRSDQADETQIATFPDASKVLSSSVALTWPRRDLYGMLWQCLANGTHGEQLRAWMAEGDWQAVEQGRGAVFIVPAPLGSDEGLQRERLHAVTGPWMGTDRRRGFPYTWIPNHLADSDGIVSPRSFLTALRAAANDTAERYPEHEHALHYESVKRGVQGASIVRVSELREDYPWVDRLFGPLSGTVVPCEFKTIEMAWEDEGVLDRLSGEIGEEGGKLPPRNLDRGPPGIREDLESLGIFRRLRDGRVDVPDVYRVGYRLGRRGGVRRRLCHCS